MKVKDRELVPQWPPAWNPFEVFLLVLSVVSSVGLLRGHSGSQVLDDRLPAIEVAIWGLMLAGGSIVALAGIYCYRTRDRLMLGLYLERTGLLLVGGATAVYSYVVLTTAADVDGVRWAVTVQTAYSVACLFRAWQDHRAIRWTHRNNNGAEAG